MKIEFLVIRPYEIDHFENVLIELVSRGIDTKIALHEEIDNSENFKILKRRNLPFSYRRNLDACVAITMYDQTYLYDYKNIKLKFKYGINPSKKTANLCSYYINGFDGILVHGRYEKDAIAKQNVIPENRIRIMGYPKNDKFFLNKKSSIEIREKYKINPPDNKKIIVYLPTWGEKSSIDIFYESLKELSPEYYIVTKPHHNNFYFLEKINRWGKLMEISNVVVDVHASFPEIVSLADIIIADAKGGAFTESAMINPKAHLIGLHPVRETTENHYCPGVYDICTFVQDPKKLQSAISKTYGNKQFYKSRILFACKTFSYIGQNCSKIAATHILELAKMQKISLKPKFLRQLKCYIKKVLQ